MNSLVLPLALICSLGLAAVGLSFLALFQVKAAARNLDRKTRISHARFEASLADAQQTVSGLEHDVHELQQQTPITIVPITPRPGLNLSKRSQALRMHRRGSSPAQIAVALDVPLQEVDLLLKVHRIVLDNLIVTTRPEVDAERVGQA